MPVRKKSGDSRQSPPPCQGAWGLIPGLLFGIGNLPPILVCAPQQTRLVSAYNESLKRTCFDQGSIKVRPLVKASTDLFGGLFVNHQQAQKITASQNTGSRVRKVIAWTGLILIILASALGLAYYHASARDFYFKEIRDLTREKAGYVVAKDEPAAFSLFPRPTLTVKGLKIANPALDRHALIASVAKMSVALPWKALFRLQLDLDAELSAPKISLAVDQDGTRNWITPELAEITGGLPFDLVRVDTTEMALLFRNHQTSEILGLDIDQFDIDLRDGGGNAHIETAGRLGEARFFVLGEITRQHSENRLRVDLDFGAGAARKTRIDAIRAPSVAWWIQQNAVLFPLHGTLSGELALQQQLPSGELKFEFAAADLNEFLRFSPNLVTVKPDVGPLRANGRAVVTGSDIDIRDLDAKIDQPDIKLDLKGNVANLLSAIETALTVSAQTGDLNSIIDTTELIPAVGSKLAEAPLESGISAKLMTRGSAVTLEDVNATLRQGNLSLRLTGRMSVVDDDLDFQAEIQAEAPDSTELARILDIEQPIHPDPGPMSIAASISGTEERIYIADARAELHDGHYKSALQGIVNLSGRLPVMDLACRLDVKDAAGIGKYLKDLPDPLLDGLTVSVLADVEGPVNDFTLRNIELTTVRADRKLLVGGDVSGLPGDPKADLGIHFTMHDPVELDRYFPELGPQRLMGPLVIKGTAAYADHRLALDDLVLQAEQTDVAGSMRFDLSMNPPRIYVILEASAFQTRLITSSEPEITHPGDARDAKVNGSMTEDAQAGDQTSAPASSPDPGKLFQEFIDGIKINTGWISDLDLYLSFTAERAKLGGYNIENQELIVDARNGVFTLANFEIDLEGRPMSLRGYIDANTYPPVYHFAGEIQGETIEALLNLEDDVFVGGELNGEFNLLSEGETLGGVIRHLDGEALVTMGPVQIKSNALNVVSSDILHSMLSGVTKSKEQKQSTGYQCGVLGIDVTRGIALINKSFTLEAKDYNLAGKGRIDLNSGYVELAARPKAKKGIGLSLSSLVGGFSVEGHIATPKFGLGGGGLVSAAVVGYALTPTFTAAAATNPATATIVATGFVAKGIFDRLTASNYSCKNTLKRIERNRQKEIVPRNPHSGRMDF